MVISEALDGVPILVLANKQDVEVSPHAKWAPAPAKWGTSPRGRLLPSSVTLSVAATGEQSTPTPWVFLAVLAPLHQRQQCPIRLQPGNSCWADPGEGLERRAEAPQGGSQC